MIVGLSDSVVGRFESVGEIWSWSDRGWGTESRKAFQMGTRDLGQKTRDEPQRMRIENC